MLEEKCLTPLFRKWSTDDTNNNRQYRFSKLKNYDSITQPQQDGYLLKPRSRSLLPQVIVITSGTVPPINVQKLISIRHVYTFPTSHVNTLPTSYVNMCRYLTSICCRHLMSILCRHLTSIRCRHLTSIRCRHLTSIRWKLLMSSQRFIKVVNNWSMCRNLTSLWIPQRHYPIMQMFLYPRRSKNHWTNGLTSWTPAIWRFKIPLSVVMFKWSC